MIATDISKNQALDANPRVIKQINFIASLDSTETRTMFFNLVKTK